MISVVGSEHYAGSAGTPILVRRCGMELEVEAAPSGARQAAGWLVDAGLPGSGAVGSFLPGGFEAYARILHPARVGDRDVPWAEIARWSGRELRADCDSKDLMVRADGTHWESLDRHQGPAEGTGGLDPQRQQRLGTVLAGATATPEHIWALFDVIQYHPPSEECGYTRSSGLSVRWRSARAAARHQL
jgi:hypothetical protein